MESQYCDGSQQDLPLLVVNRSGAGKGDDRGRRRQMAHLVHHHHSEQIAHRRKHQPIKVVLHGKANVLAKNIEQNLPDNEEEDGEEDVSQRPALLQRAHHEQHLHDGVDGEEDGVENVDDDKQANGVGWAQPGPALEREERDGEADDEEGERGEAQQPDG